MGLLEIKNVDASYGDMKVLRKVSFVVEPKEIVSILGGNGSGKTTTLKTISGIIRAEAGEIMFGGESIRALSTTSIVGRGIVQVPEGRILFNKMTVRENLEMGSYLRHSKKYRSDSIEKIYSLFPILKERESQSAGTLSGGQQQMLAIGRGLMGMPKILMLDEPSLGLGPIVVNTIFSTFDKLNKQGLTILLVEQNVMISLSICDRAYLMENGEVVLCGSGRELLANENIRSAYLGI